MLPSAPGLAATWWSAQAAVGASAIDPPSAGVHVSAAGQASTIAVWPDVPATSKLTDTGAAPPGMEKRTAATEVAPDAFAATSIWPGPGARAAGGAPSTGAGDVRVVGGAGTDVHQPMASGLDAPAGTAKPKSSAAASPAPTTKDARGGFMPGLPP